MNITSLNPAFGSKYKHPELPKEKAPLLIGEDALIVSGSVPLSTLQAYFAPKLSMSPEATNVLNQLVNDAKNGKGDKWSYSVKVDGGTQLSCNIDGKEYKLESVSTGKSYVKDGKTHREMNYALVVNTPGEPEKSYPLSKEEFLKATKDLEEVAYPIIEKQYGLDKGLDATNIILDLATKTIDKDITWEQLDSQMGIGKDALLEAVAQIQTILPDETKITITQAIANNIFSRTVKNYIGLEKPGLPPQTFMIGSETEKESFEFLATGLALDAKEQELLKGMQEIKMYLTLIDGEKEKVKESIERFKTRDQN